MIQRLVFFALASLLAGPAAAQVQPREPRTLTRTVDTVVVSGPALGRSLLGTPKERLRVYACRAGFMVPVPFQIDERDQEGRYCWTGGAKDSRRHDADRGKLDSNDELVVLARQAGDRATALSLAMVPGHDAVQEIELRDPVDGGKAWVYLFRFPRATPGIAAFDVASLEIKDRNDDGGLYIWTGEHFQFNNGRSPSNAVRATWAGLVPKGQRDFRNATNLLDSTQVRAVVSFMWVTVVRQSHEFRVEVGGLIDGPLRVVAENRAQLYLALGVWVSAPESYVILWPNKVSMPTNAACPVNLDESDESNYSLCVDMRAGAELSFYNSHNAQPVAIDGMWSQAERELDLTFPDWNCVYGPQGGMISKFVIPDFLRQRKDSKLLYVDDKDHKRPEDGDAIEFEKGAYGYHGYRMDMVGLKKGVYQGDYMVWYAPPPFAPGDEQPYVAEYERPIVASASEHATADSEAK